MTNSRLDGPSSPHGYAFGPFVVDRVRQQLWRDGRPVSITTKTLDLLVVLLECGDRLVTKDELMDRVWPGTIVQENNLARQISSLRRALGQRPDQHDYLVTVPSQGYRFVAEVRPHPIATSALPRSDTVPPPAFPGGAVPQADDGHRRRRIGLLAAAACVAVGVAAAVPLLRRAGPSAPPRTLQRITYEEASVPREASWSPDGAWVVYTSDRAGNADLWKQRPGDPDPVRLTWSDANESQPAWSPDGRSIVFRSERDGGGLYVMPAAGGAERLISSFGYEPRWSPDGTRVLFKRSAVVPDLPTIYVAGLDGRPPRAVRPDVVKAFSSLNAAWHPDGRVSLWGTVGTNTTRFITLPIESGASTVPDIAATVERGLANASPGRFTWARSGRYLYFEDRAREPRNIWRVTVEPVKGRWTAGPERLTTGAGDETDLALSPDGSRLLFTAMSSRTRLWAFPLDAAGGRITGSPMPITDGSTGEVDFDARDDGKRLVYQTVRAGRSELRERSVANGQDRLLLASQDWKFAKPRWSPDGATLAFSRYGPRDHSLALAVLNSDGTGQRVLTRPGEVEMQASDWSRDGRAILGSCRFDRTDRYSTCLMTIAGAAGAADPRVRVLASDPQRNLYNQRFSPDQRWISFLAHDLLYASTSTVFVVPAGGGPWRAITDGAWFDDKPRWGPDGRILYFVSNRTGVANIWARRFDPRSGMPSGEPFPVTSFRSAQFALTPRTVQMDIAVSPAHLLLPVSEARSELWMLDGVDR